MDEVIKKSLFCFVINRGDTENNRARVVNTDLIDFKRNYSLRKMKSSKLQKGD